MTAYSTQMEAARKGIVTPQMEAVLAVEPISKEDLLQGIAAGRIAIPCNKAHTCLPGIAVGRGLTTKINVNLGVSKDECAFEREMKKADMAVAHKAHALMDLSVAGDTEAFRKQLVEKVPLMIGTVPIYDTLTDRKSVV